MPETVGNFKRGTILRFDAEGLDVGVSYNLNTASRHIAATVYVYPAPHVASIGSTAEVIAGARARLAEDEFQRRINEIIHAHPGAVPIHQRDVSRSANGKSYPGKCVVFEYEDVFAGARMPVRSHLYLFCYVDGKWVVKYRFTHPKSEDAEKEIADFIEKWSWDTSH